MVKENKLNFWVKSMKKDENIAFLYRIFHFSPKPRKTTATPPLPRSGGVFLKIYTLVLPESAEYVYSAL